jgi:hypothetical protein
MTNTRAKVLHRSSTLQVEPDGTTGPIGANYATNGEWGQTEWTWVYGARRH